MFIRSICLHIHIYIFDVSTYVRTDYHVTHIFDLYTPRKINMDRANHPFAK